METASKIDLKSLSLVPQSDRDLVKGYLRHYEQVLKEINDNNPYYNIPELVMILTLFYYTVIDRFDPDKKHKYIKISNDGLTATKITSSNWYRNVYGSVGIDSMDQKKYQWTVTIAKHITQIYIGVATDRYISDSQSNTWKKVTYGVDTLHGLKWNRGDDSKYGNGIKLRNGDKLTISIDFKRREIAFSRNGENFGVAFTEIEIGPQYYLCASLYIEGESVTINDLKCIG